MKYTFIKDYRDHDEFRKSLNELTEKTYGFNFEEWYECGFWGEKYVPHSLVDHGRVIANVSVNLMDFEIDGITKHYIQIGTVMTAQEYRRQGLSRYLMEKVIDEYKEIVDGIYLFGNDSVLEFYPKFGFRKSIEYQYSKDICSNNDIMKVKHLDMSNKDNQEKFLSGVRESISNDRLTMDNLGLMAFWTMGSDSIYYLAEEEAYIIAEIEKDELVIHQVIASHKIDLDTIIGAFGSEIKRVELGFTPSNEEGYNVKELHKEDCTLFILGEDLAKIEEKKLMFPTLSHA